MDPTLKKTRVTFSKGHELHNFNFNEVSLLYNVLNFPARCRYRLLNVYIFIKDHYSKTRT